MKQETWKSLKGIVKYGENYEVSDQGNVRSIDRMVNSKHGKRKIKGKVLKPHKDKDGYLRIDLHNNRKHKKYGLHRLVALSFIKNPLSKPTVNHKNGAKSNNRLSNLEWATHSENTQHSFNIGLKRGLKGENSPSTNLTNEEVIEMINLYKTDGYSLYELAQKYKISDSAVSQIVSRKRWTHLNIEGHKRDLSKKSIITDELVKTIKKMKEKDYSKRRMERESGVSRTTVTKILNNYL